MLDYRIIKDAKTGEELVETSLSRSRLQHAPSLNKGTAFTPEEREAFHITGRLPDAVENLDEQVARAYHQYQEKTTDIAKNVYLNNVHDINEVLFYKLVSEHLEEMLPIIYTPTVGEAVEKYSLELRRPRGLYFSFNNQDKMDEIFSDRVDPNTDLVLVTDGEGVLGIGDWGVGGMDISIGKLMVYTLCAGVNPNRFIPIQLDVGTDNEALLNDPMYLGWRHKRVRGAKYDAFIEKFVTSFKKNLPGAFLHWEDFGRDNARKNLQTYRDTVTSFNDDMQGTGATALAVVLSGIKAAKGEVPMQRVVILGAGTAGCGIADQVHAAMVNHGLSEEEAYQHFWLVDRNGLLVNDMDSLVDFQKPYACQREEVSTWDVKDPKNITLQEVVDNAHPTVLIGCSTVHGAFNEAVVKSMAAHCERPIILPLSNPTSLSEADPKDVIEWTDGKAFIATGSPFDPVIYKGKTHIIGQSNNAFVFPGLGLSVIATKAKKVSDGMLHAASECLSDHSPARKDPNASLLPSIADTWDLSRNIAMAVAVQARKEGLLGIPDDADLGAAIDAIRWRPKYYPYRFVQK
jgi:malate dehydrogenase (oxaloacetate-decarboxylating)